MFCIVTDHLGTPREMFTEDGNLAWAAQYRTWGGIKRTFQPENDNVAYTSPPPLRGAVAFKYDTAEQQIAQDCPIRFQGQWEDEETGLYYNRYRYYDPLTAQYLSPDPIGLAGGFRSQGYVNNPSIWIDPWGLSCCIVKNVSPDDLIRTHTIEGKTSSKKVQKIVESMRENGFGNEAIHVLEHDGAYYVVDGHHRLAAAKRAGVNVDIQVVDPKTIFGPNSYKDMQDVLDSALSTGSDILRGANGKRW